MARMHARRKGRSSSLRPYRTEAPKWVTLEPEEIEQLIEDMAKEGLSSSVIGIRLRDQYGIPNVKLVTNKKITQIMKERGVMPKLPEDLASLMKKAVHLHEYLLEHPKDLHNRRGLQLIEAKIMRLQKYYKRTGVLPPKWKYSIKTAKLYVE